MRSSATPKAGGTCRAAPAPPDCWARYPTPPPALCNAPSPFPSPSLFTHPGRGHPVPGAPGRPHGVRGQAARLPHTHTGRDPRTAAAVCGRGGDRAAVRARRPGKAPCPPGTASSGTYHAEQPVCALMLGPAWATRAGSAPGSGQQSRSCQQSAAQLPVPRPVRQRSLAAPSPGFSRRPTSNNS